MEPKFDLDKIKFSIDEPTWGKAIVLLEKGKVTKFEGLADGFGAVVMGTSPYQVFVSAKHYDRGSCDCYLGQKEILCKHLVAVAIRAVVGNRKLSIEEKDLNHQIKNSGKTGELSATEIADIKADVSSALKYIKPYSGPSKTWFAYQDSLQEGCNRLAKIVSVLPVSRQTTDLLVNLLLRLDKKLTHGGVDDSDGTVGGLITDVVALLEEFCKLDPTLAQSFSKFYGIETCFGWEEPLVKMADEL